MGPAKHLNEIRSNTGDGPGASRLEGLTNLGAVFLGNHVKNGTEQNPNEMPFKRDVYEAVWERIPEGAQGSSPWCRRVCGPLLVNVPGLGMHGKFALRVGFHPEPR